MHGRLPSSSLLFVQKEVDNLESLPSICSMVDVGQTMTSYEELIGESIRK